MSCSGQRGVVKFGIRKPSIRKVIAVRTSPARFVRHSLGLKAKLQIITLAELFQGKKPDILFGDPASVKRAKREDTSQQGNLL